MNTIATLRVTTVAHFTMGTVPIQCTLAVCSSYACPLPLLLLLLLLLRLLSLSLSLSMQAALDMDASLGLEADDDHFSEPLALNGTTELSTLSRTHSLARQSHIINQNGATSGFEMCFAPSTLGAGTVPTKTRLESRFCNKEV